MENSIQNGNPRSVGIRARRVVQVIAGATLFSVVAFAGVEAQVNQEGKWLVAANQSYPIYDNEVQKARVMVTVCVATEGAGAGGISVNLLSGNSLVKTLFITGPGACHTTLADIPTGDSIAVTAPAGAQSGTYMISSPLH
ncbi:MAG TPA: hypothetical protein VEJ16_00095 [Alphaproteobacteria bacterium]|nr:hypothetical protein [Alphaproteobacteria bacterium]